MPGETVCLCVLDEPRPLSSYVLKNRKADRMVSSVVQEMPLELAERTVPPKPLSRQCPPPGRPATFIHPLTFLHFLPKHSASGFLQDLLRVFPRSVDNLCFSISLWPYPCIVWASLLPLPDCEFFVARVGVLPFCSPPKLDQCLIINQS